MSLLLGAAPPAAHTVFADRLPVLEAYAALLAGPGVERGLIGPRESPRLWERHLLNCAGLAELIAPGQVVLDLGSGAGLPGLVLAALRPDLTVVLVEPLLRRSTFLTEAVAALELSQVVVRRARAEELAGTLLVDVVTARAVAPLDKLLGWGLPLLRPGGRLLALKGERADAELADSGAAVTAGGGADARVVEVGDEALSTLARVVVVERTAAKPAKQVKPTSADEPSARPARSGKAGSSGRPGGAGTPRSSGQRGGSGSSGRSGTSGRSGSGTSGGSRRASGSRGSDRSADSDTSARHGSRGSGGSGTAAESDRPGRPGGPRGTGGSGRPAAARPTRSGGAAGSGGRESGGSGSGAPSTGRPVRRPQP